MEGKINELYMNSAWTRITKFFIITASRGMGGEWDQREDPMGLH